MKILFNPVQMLHLQQEAKKTTPQSVAGLAAMAVRLCIYDISKFHNTTRSNIDSSSRVHTKNDSCQVKPDVTVDRLRKDWTGFIQFAEADVSVGGGQYSPKI